MRREREEHDDNQRADQWSAGGTLPDFDETWAMPPNDPEATVSTLRTTAGARRRDSSPSAAGGGQAILPVR